MLFFPVHEAFAEEKVRCIDGVTRNADDFDIDGLTGLFGLMVEVSDGRIALYPALYDDSGNAPFPQVHLQGTCSVVEEAMTTFVLRHTL